MLVSTTTWSLESTLCSRQKFLVWLRMSLFSASGIWAKFLVWLLEGVPIELAARRSLRLAPIAIKITGETWNSRLTAILFFFFSENFRNVKNLENTTVHGHLRLTTIRGWSFAKRVLIDRLMFYRGYGDVSIELNVIFYPVILPFGVTYSHWSSKLRCVHETMKMFLYWLAIAT